jgi:hypothetical protein
VVPFILRLRPLSVQLVHLGPVRSVVLLLLFLCHVAGTVLGLQLGGGAHGHPAAPVRGRVRLAGVHGTHRDGDVGITPRECNTVPGQVVHEEQLLVVDDGEVEVRPEAKPPAASVHS